jgi:signal transduction histidine kinase
MKTYWDTYQTVSMKGLNCKGDLLVKNWSSYRRYGYASAPALVGDPSWIARIKDLVEFFYTEIHVILAAIFLMFYLAVRSLRRINSIHLISTPFEQWSIYWLFFTFVMSDVVIDVLFPFSFDFWTWLVPRVAYFFGITMIAGAMFTFVSGAKTLPLKARNWAGWLVEPRKRVFGLSFLAIFTLILNVTPFFAIGYRAALVVLGLSNIVLATKERNLMMGLFGICALSDFGKTVMVPYLPVPKLTLVYVGIVLIYSIILQIRLFEETAKTEGKNDLAAQVAHDIWSPLNTLNLIIPTLSEVPEQKRLMMRGAVVRIQEIAQDLISKYKQSIRAYESFHECYVLNIIDQVVKEKNLQITQVDRVKIEMRIESDGLNAFCKLSPVQLIRALSNLINNSIEALEDQPGEVIVGLSADENHTWITVTDNGPGISLPILQKLGEKGTSSGKLAPNSGSGLGVHHAKKVVEEWGGNFSIETAQNKGTRVILRIPRAKAPKWFVSKLQVPVNAEIIVLDDDPLIHEIWSRRFTEAGYDARKIHLYRKVDQLRDYSGPQVLYLVDHYLSGSSQTGLEVIQAQGIAKSSILVTQSFDEIEVREQCEKLGVRMLPKVLVDRVPIRVK